MAMGAPYNQNPKAPTKSSSGIMTSPPIMPMTIENSDGFTIVKQPYLTSKERVPR